MGIEDYHQAQEDRLRRIIQEAADGHCYGAAIHALLRAWDEELERKHGITGHRRGYVKAMAAVIEEEYAALRGKETDHA